VGVFRSLAHTPKWAALVILTLAVGIGAATAVFGVVDAVLINPLPYAHVERLREVRTQTLEGRRADPDSDRMEIYVPYQRATPFSAFFTFMVRASGEEVAIARDIKAQLWKLDPKLPIVDVSNMDRRLRASAAHPRFLVGLASAFAAVAVLLAGIGVYGTAAYWVATRSRDLGIRIALGANRHAVLKLVLARGLRLALWGGAAGMLASLAATRTLAASLLFETSPRDPSVLFAAAAALVGVALVACCLPAIHAARVDPANVLRIE
jgi:putative ABC transport system permease protein